MKKSFHNYNTLGVPGLVLNSVDNIGNPFQLFDGDMASGCFDNVVPPVIDPKINEITVPSQSQLNSYTNPTTSLKYDLSHLFQAEPLLK